MRPRVLHLLIAQLLCACDVTPDQDSQVTKTSNNAPVQKQTGVDFCNPTLYPVRKRRSASYKDIDEHAGSQLKEEELAVLTGKTRDCTTPTKRFSFQTAQPGYCAFILSVAADDPLLMLTTYNERESTSDFLPVAGWWSGVDESRVNEGFIRFWHQTSARFPYDTLVEVIDRWTVKVLKGGKQQETPFFIDSVTTRFSILPNGSFKQRSLDSIRIERRGNAEKYNGLPLE